MAAYQLALPKLAAEEIGVLSASTDAQADAEREAAELKLTFPLGYGLDAAQVSALTGAFYKEEPSPHGRFLHATGIVINAQHKVVNAVFSTGAQGRLSWQEVLGLVQFLKKRTP